MRTLIIVSHPTLSDSHAQQFLRESLPDEGVRWHHLEHDYPDGQIDKDREQALLADYDRIIFQFPLYWYSSPPLLKQWQDEVLTDGFAYGKHGSQLKGKEFGLVMTTGVNEREYQAGGREGFTISELTRPFQAIARKCEMVYLPSLLIARFDYLSDADRKELLIRYRQYLTMSANPSLLNQEEWFKLELETLGKFQQTDETKAMIDLLIEQMRNNRDHLDDLLFTLEELGEW